MRKHTSKIRKELDASGDKVRRARLPKRMRIAFKIADGIDALDWGNKDLAAKLGKYQSEISKWLKGDHNFTLDTLSDIEEILGIQLLNLEKKTPVEKESASSFHAVNIEGSNDYNDLFEDIAYTEVADMSEIDHKGGRAFQPVSTNTITYA